MLSTRVIAPCTAFLHNSWGACAQALVSRETSPLGTAVVSVTKQAAGEGAYNVIPETASFGGTIRSLSHDHLMQLKRRINEVRGQLQDCRDHELLVLY